VNGRDESAEQPAVGVGIAISDSNGVDWMGSTRAGRAE
jgi:hypothetical protein